MHALLSRNPLAGDIYMRFSGFYDDVTLDGMCVARIST